MQTPHRTERVIDHPPEARSPQSAGSRPTARGPARPGLRIGIDVGGTKIEAVALGEDGAVIASTRLPTTTGPDGILAGITAAIGGLSDLSGIPVADFVGIGIGIPGQVDREPGIIRNAYNLEIGELDLGRRISSSTGLPVTVDNDVTAAALGAAHTFGFTGTTAYLNLGTGLAAGIVVDGMPLHGAHGCAGEIGHLPIDSRRRPCPCGQHGCLETVASGAALRQYWAGAGEHPGRTLLPALEAGDPDAQEALAALVHGAAEAVRVLVLTYDPDAVVIGGGLRLLGAPLATGITRVLDGWAAQSPFIAGLEIPERIRTLPRDSPAAALGAALTAAR